MIDDKIQEQQEAQQPASPPPLTTKEKLRAFWARIQCSSLLRRHHFRARTRHRMEGFSAILRHIPLARQTGEFLYSLGFTGEYTMIQAWRTTRAAALWLAAAFLAAWHQVAEIAFPGARTVLRELFDPIYLFCRGIRNIWVSATPSGGRKASGPASPPTSPIWAGASPATPGWCPKWWSTSCP